MGLVRLTDADPCVFSTGKKDVTIGERTAVCLVVSPLEWEVDGENRWYSQVLITPKADEFSRFNVDGSWQSTVVQYDAEGADPILATFGDKVGVHVESTGKYSYQKAFRLVDEGKTFPIFTAIISVDEGEVTGVSWDDGCHFCDSSRCEENTYTYAGNLTDDPGKDCYWEDSECMSSGDSVSSVCQLMVYVVWTGTDTEGNYFTSSAKRLSNFAGATIDSYIDSAASTFETFD